MSEYQETYDRWASSLQTYDYYIVGLVGATLAFVVHDLKVERFAINSGTFQLSAIVALSASFICGILRLERTHMLFRFENEKLKIGGYRNRIRAGGAEQQVIRETDLAPMTSAEVVALESKLDRNFALLQDSLKKTGAKMGIFYSLRDWLFLTGLLLLVVSRFLMPVAATQSEWQVLAQPNGPIVRVHNMDGRVEYYTSQGWLPLAEAAQVLNGNAEPK